MNNKKKECAEKENIEKTPKKPPVEKVEKSQKKTNQVVEITIAS